MATRADLDLAARALNGLSAQARAAFVREWNSLPDHRDLRAVRAVLSRFWPDLIGSYGELAAALGADMAEMMLAEMDVAGSAESVRPVDAERANARMGWAIGQADQLGCLLGILDELVKQPYRSTVARTGRRTGTRFARVPNGETCAFCLMLGSRGAVYHSKVSAGGVTKFHGDCDCGVILVRDERDYPSGYDPDALYRTYLDAAAGSTKKTLANLREAQGIN